MRVLLWHVHGSWTTAFVQGRHTYLVPLSARPRPGRPRPGTDVGLAGVRRRGARSPAPRRADRRRRPAAAAEEGSTAKLAGRTPGADLPAVYVEHNAPRRATCRSPGIRWPTGRTCRSCTSPTSTTCSGTAAGRRPRVIEHGIVDPGPLWTGELARAAVVVNEPLRRGRHVGDRPAAVLRATAPLDVFGMGVSDLPSRLGMPDVRPFEDLPQAQMHARAGPRAGPTCTPSAGPPSACR